jgi:hypothetical protein
MNRYERVIETPKSMTLRFEHESHEFFLLHEALLILLGQLISLVSVIFELYIMNQTPIQNNYIRHDIGNYYHVL